MRVLIPTGLAEALSALDDDPTSTVLAGGTDVMVEVNSGHRRPQAVIAVVAVWWVAWAGRRCRRRR